MNYCYNCGAPLNGKLPNTCAKCSTDFWQNPRCCVGALTIRNNQLLLVRRLSEPWQGYWDIPGGYCEAYEHPENCATRETLEETGISIKIQQYHGIWLDPVSSSIFGHNICIYFIAEPIGNSNGTPDGSETDLVQWFDINALPVKLAFPHHIPDVLKKLVENFIK